jgi:hypothetical protein
MTDDTLHPTLLCRMHLHHKWVPAHTEDGAQYMRCAHCGAEKVEPDTSGGMNPGAGGMLAG